MHPGDHPTFTIASFNLHRGLDVRNRPFDVAAACAALDADVIGLQEAWREDDGSSHAVEIAARLGMQVHEGAVVAGPMQPNGQPLPWRVALVSRLPTRPLADLPIPTTAGWCNDRPAARITVDVGGRQVVVACVHLCHRPHASYAQLRSITAALAADPPDVVVGDFNLWATGVRLALPNWTRVVRGRTWPSWFPHSQIDHVLIGPRLEVVDAAVERRMGSDHRPVKARLRVVGS